MIFLISHLIIWPFFSKDIDNFGKSYQNNIENFKNFFKYISNLRTISLKSTKKLLICEFKLKKKFLSYAKI